MRSLVVLLIATVGATASVASAQPSTVAFVKPKAIKALPPHVAAALERQNCLVPQFRLGPDAELLLNAISGEFAAKGQTDWAILCEHEHRWSILVVWGGPASCPNELPDRAKLAETVDRYIRAVSEQEVTGFSTPPKPGMMEHQGIEDLMDDKYGIVYYCTAGQWTVAAEAGS